MGPVTELIWSDIYEQAVDSFGGTTPGGQLEQQLLDHFRRHPAALQAAINKLAERYAAGKVHSPWPLVLTELQREDQRATVTANVNRERDTQTHLAEVYITNAGLYLPTEDEVIDDTFGPHGRLKQWADDTELQERILQHWRDQQPRAKAAETDVTARAEKWKTANPGREAAPRTSAATTATPEQPEPEQPATTDIDWSTP